MMVLRMRFRNRLHGTALVIGSLAFGGCDQREQQASAPNTLIHVGANDARSIGDATPAHVTAQQWRLDSVPTLSIGSLDEGPEAFGSVQAVALDSNGNLYVANGATLEIRAFTPNGAHRWTSGGSGSGPGEYQGLRSVHYCAEGLIVADLYARRLTLLSDDGRAISTEEWKPVRRGSVPSIFTCDATGTRVFLDRVSPADVPPGPHTVSAVVGGSKSDHDGVRLITEFPGFDRYRYETVDGPAEFGKSTFVAAGPEHVFVADGAEPAIFAYDLSGTLQTIIRWDHNVEPLTEDLISSALNQRVRVLPEHMRPEYRRIWKAMKHPQVMPAISAVIPSQNGDLWVKKYDVEATEAPQHWWIISPERGLRAIAQLPQELNLLLAGEGFIIALVRDPLGVEAIERYTLIPA